MTFRIAVGAIGVLSLGVALWAAENSPGKADPGPRYDTQTVIAFEAVVSEVRTKESMPEGVSLMVKNDSDAAWTVYLGPADFVKGFDITFKKGDRIHVTGSKVKLGGGEVLVLAREVRKESATLYLRGKEGEPYW
jgi:hypothetical protein